MQHVTIAYQFRSLRKKLLRLLVMRRVYAAISAALVATLHEQMGLDKETAIEIVSILLTWLLGDSLARTGPPGRDTIQEKTEDMIGSVRVWVALVAIVHAVFIPESVAFTAVANTFILGRSLSYQRSKGEIT